MIEGARITSHFHALEPTNRIMHCTCTRVVNNPSLAAYTLHIYIFLEASIKTIERVFLLAFSAEQHHKYSAKTVPSQLHINNA